MDNEAAAGLIFFCTLTGIILLFVSTEWSIHTNRDKLIGHFMCGAGMSLIIIAITKLVLIAIR